MAHEESRSKSAYISNMLGWLVVTAVAVYAALVGYSRLAQPATTSASIAMNSWSRYASPGKRSVLLLVYSQCPFCQAEKPFYKALVNSSRSTSLFDVHLLTANVDAGTKQFSKDVGIIPNILSVDEIKELKVTGTPTLVLISTNKKVEVIHVGRLDPGVERHLGFCLAVNKQC